MLTDVPVRHAGPTIRILEHARLAEISGALKQRTTNTNARTQMSRARKAVIMIEFAELKFGDKVYIVKETVQTRNRFVMTDADGVEWHRYDNSRWLLSIEEIEYVGRVTVVEEGEARFDEDRCNEFHFKYESGQIYGEAEGADEYHLDTWFSSEEEAEDHITILKATRKDTQ
jgi:hypothetical protein